jgi:predicted membrane metal-binding protein
MFKHVVHVHIVKFLLEVLKVFDVNFAYSASAFLEEVVMKSWSKTRVHIRQPIESPPGGLWHWMARG